MQKYFFPPGKHTNFHQGHKVFKAKGHMVIKARGQENLKPIFCTFYSSVSPFHPLLRHNIPNITEPMEIANCELARYKCSHAFLHLFAGLLISVITLWSWIQVTGLLIKTHHIFLKILLFQPGLWVKSLPCLQFQPGLKPSLVTSKQKWCHCHINRRLVCSVFQPGLW